MTWESGEKSPSQTQDRAKQVYRDFLAALHKFSGINVVWTKESYDIVRNVSQKTLALINLGFTGNEDALDRAEGRVREIESAYHMAPANMKRPPQASRISLQMPVNRDMEIERLLEAMQPLTGWKKWRDLMIAGPVFTIIGGVGTLLILRLIGYGHLSRLHAHSHPSVSPFLHGVTG